MGTSDDEAPLRAETLVVTYEHRVRAIVRVMRATVLPFLLLPVVAWFAPRDVVRDLAALSALLLLIAIALWAIVPPLLAAAARGRLGQLVRETLGAAVRSSGLAVWSKVGQVQIPRQHLAMAWVVQPKRVEVLTHDGDALQLDFPTERGAVALVRDVRLAAGHDRAYRVPLEAVWVRLLRQVSGFTVPLALSSMFLYGGPWMSPAVAIGGLLGWLLSRGTRGLHLGADGLVVEGRFRKRYVAYRDVATVHLVGQTRRHASARVELIDGTSLRLGWALPESRARLVKALIEEGAAMAKRGEEDGARVGALDRGSEDAARWRARVASIGRSSGYRGVALDPAQLLALMRNPAADPDQRVAAALAIRVEPGGAARVRVAADASTEPRVREVFELLAVEEVDEQRLDQVLRGVARR